MDALIQIIDDLILSGGLNGERKGKTVSLRLPRGTRQQQIQIREDGSLFEFSSQIANVRDVGRVTKTVRRALQFRIWRLNALKPVVCLSMDESDRIFGSVSFPIESAHKNEVEFYLVILARECDRFEYILTGSDLN